MLIALTHAPSKQMGRCELTHRPREPIDYDRARRQHRQYCRALRGCGAAVRTLTVNADFPDCAFLEDTAVILDEMALIASMGAPSRRGETRGVEAVLRTYRRIERIEPPATIEGGDVLRVDRTLLAGLSSRSNEDGARALEAIARPYGYRVVRVPVRGCLHLKTACSALDSRTLLVNPDWIDAGALAGFRLVRVPQEEPWSANLVRIGGAACLCDAHPQTARMLRQRGLAVKTVNISEFVKAEGGATCLSLVFESGLPPSSA